jgi:NTE family protein
MNQAISSRQSHEANKLCDCLQGMHFLHRLKPDELEKLLAAMKKRVVPAGAAVYRQGDKAEALYLVASGNLGVWQRLGFKSRKVAGLHKDEYFGDNSLLGAGRHGSSVVAETDCQLYVLYREDFERLLMSNRDIADAVKAHVSQVRRADQLH